MGNPYVYGGTSLTNGADCSGFVMSVFANFGISLPHEAAAQSGYGTAVDVSSLQPGDRVLIIDDFLANGAALDGMIDLVRQSGAELVGAGIAIEKAFQPGGERIRASGVRVESLARIAEMGDDGSIRFA